MEQKHISGMEGLHHTHLDIDDFLGEIVNYIKENEISEDVFLLGGMRLICLMRLLADRVAKGHSLMT